MVARTSVRRASAGSSGEFLVKTGTAQESRAGEILMKVGRGDSGTGGDVHLRAGDTVAEGSATAGTGGIVEFITGVSALSSSGSFLLETVNAGAKELAAKSIFLLAQRASVVVVP